MHRKYKVCQASSLLFKQDSHYCRFLQRSSMSRNGIDKPFSTNLQAKVDNLYAEVGYTLTFLYDSQY